MAGAEQGAGEGGTDGVVVMGSWRLGSGAFIPDTTGTANPADQLTAMIPRTTQHESALATHAQLRRDIGLTEPERVRALQAHMDGFQQRSSGRSLSR